MLDDRSATWWYEQDGQQAGPVTAAALQRLVAEGHVSPAHRVWKSGMAAWEPLGQVAELRPLLEAAGALPPPLGPPPPPPSGGSPPPWTAQPGPGWSRAPPSPAGQLPPGWPTPPPPLATTPAYAFELIPVGTTILLAVVTFGVYGIVKFHQTGRAYEQLAARTSRFGLYFWLFVGLGVGGVLLNAKTGGVGIPLAIASAVFQVLTLNEALAVRDEGARRHGIAVPLTSASTHRTLLILAIVLSPILVGLVLGAIQAMKWFNDWNAIVGGVKGRSAERGR